MQSKLKEYVKSLTIEDIFKIKDSPTILYRHKNPLSLFSTQQTFSKYKEELFSLLDSRFEELILESYKEKFLTQIKKDYILFFRKHTSLDEKLIEAVTSKGYEEG
jgi:hypothetical protein